MHHPNFKDTIAASPYVFALGVAGDSGSGKTLVTQGERNVSKGILSQNRMIQSIENIDLSLDLYSILSLSERNFSRGSL